MRLSRLPPLLVCCLLALAMLSDPARAQWHSCGLIVCDEPHHQLNPAVVADSQGGTIVLWDDRRGGPDIYALRLDAAGNVVLPWPATGAALTDTLTSQYFVAAVSDGADGAIAVWIDYRNGNVDVYAQRVTAGGEIAPGWPRNGVPICTAADNQTVTGIVTDGAGGAIIVWFDHRDGLRSRAYVSRVTADGAIAPGWSQDGAPVTEVSRNQSYPVLAPDGQHGAIVAWSEIRNGQTDDVFAQRVSGAGEMLWGADGDTISSITDNISERSVSIAPDGSGGAILAWERENWHTALISMRSGLRQRAFRPPVGLPAAFPFVWQSARKWPR